MECVTRIIHEMSGLGTPLAAVAVAAVYLGLTRMFHELLAATADMAVLPDVLGCRTLRRTVQVRLRSNTLRLLGGTPIFTVSRQQCMKHPG
jgi:hypothetical protein